METACWYAFVVGLGFALTGWVVSCIYKKAGRFIKLLGLAIVGSAVFWMSVWMIAGGLDQDGLDERDVKQHIEEIVR